MMKCGHCGTELKNTNLRGDTFCWKKYTSLELLFDFYADKCPKCSEVTLNGKQAKELDILLEKGC